MKKKKVNNLNQKEDIIKSIFVVMAVLVFLGLFYILTLYITKKHRAEENQDDENVEVSISYSSISIGRALSMSDGEYYVLFYDTTDEEVADTYKELFDNYKYSENPLPSYYVDMGTAIHKKFISEEANYEINSEADFKINGPTLIKVQDHKVIQYTEGEEINNILS